MRCRASRPRVRSRPVALTIPCLVFYSISAVAGLAVDPTAAARAALLAAMTPTAAGNLLRMAFHDAGTFSNSTTSNGANGSIRFEFNDAVDEGLSFGIPILESVMATLRSQGVAISWADLVQLGGAVAVQEAGGPFINIVLGRTDTNIPDAALTAVLPVPTATSAQLQQLFGAKGFSARELVALSGAHAIGSSQFTAPVGAMTQQPNVFSSHYYKELLAGGGAFPSDKSLLSDPATAQWVQTYAADEALFFADFSAAYVKLGLLGASFR